MKIGMCFFLPVKPFHVYAAVFENAQIVLFAAAENGVAVGFVNVYAHLELMLGEAGDFFNLLFCGVFEEEAVGVAIENLDAYLFAVVEDLGDAVPADGCCGFSNGWAVEVEAFGAEDAVAGVQDDFECSLGNVVPASLFLRQGFVFGA